MLAPAFFSLSLETLGDIKVLNIFAFSQNLFLFVTLIIPKSQACVAVCAFVDYLHYSSFYLLLFLFPQEPSLCSVWPALELGHQGLSQR